VSDARRPPAERRQERGATPGWRGASPGEPLGHLRPRTYKAPLEVRLKRRTRRLRQLHGFLIEELGERLRVPLATRIAALRHGFSSLHWRLYELDRNDPRDYLPTFADLDFGLGRPHVVALRDKLTFALVMGRLGVRHPRALGYVHGGRLSWLGDGPDDRQTGGLADVARRRGGLVVKPVAGAAGNRVVLVTVEGGSLRANGDPCEERFLDAMVEDADGLLVTELASQGRYAATIAPAAVNTVRLLTMWDQGRPFVAEAAHRFGLPRTYPIDNFHGGRGGLSAPIDLDSGVLGPAATLAAGGTLQRFETHPDSGTPIAGVPVPRWAEVVAEALRVAGRLPHLPYVGWDLVVNEEEASFLEANTPPGTLVWQVHGGLLRDPRVRRACAALGLR